MIKNLINFFTTKNKSYVIDIPSFEKDILYSYGNMTYDNPNDTQVKSSLVYIDENIEYDHVEDNTVLVDFSNKDWDKSAFSVSDIEFKKEFVDDSGYVKERALSIDSVDFNSIYVDTRDWYYPELEVVEEECSCSPFELCSFIK